MEKIFNRYKGDEQLERRTTLAYEPDTGRIASMLAAGSTNAFRWTYLSGSDLKETLTYPNGDVVRWEYEPQRDLLTLVSNATHSAYRYTYDPAGRRISKNDEMYGYNSRDELILATNVVDGTTFAYAYDDIGNRLWSCEFGTNTTYTANSLNQYTEIVRGGVPEYPAFDADGNQTDITTGTGRWLVEYNGENRPVRWTRPIDGKVLEMSYDRRGRRVRSDGDTFVYDDYLNIGVTVWDPTEPVATRPLVWLNGSSPAYYFHDGNKNVADVVSDTGTTQYSYAPFGMSVSSGGFAEENLCRFSSEVHDDSLGLAYYNYRHLSLKDGRWMVYDKLELTPSQSFYLYVQNNVLNTWDYVGMYGNPVSDGRNQYPSQPLSIEVPALKLPDGEGCPIKRCPKNARVITDWSGSRYRTGRDNGKPKEVNGCGAEGGRKYPNSYFHVVDFTDCCNDHDVCYGTCSQKKDACDRHLGDCMRSQCDKYLALIFHERAICRRMADIYELAVGEGGDDAYESAQDKGCEWEPCLE